MGCLQLLAIMNKPAEEILVYIFWGASALISLKDVHCQEWYYWVTPVCLALVDITEQFS